MNHLTNKISDREQPNQGLTAERQKAVLDALPARLALLDHEGRIMLVNEAWHQFALRNDFRGLNFGIGENYLKACEQAEGDGAETLHRAAEGIRSVLGRRSSYFELDYAWHSPDEQRWFRLMVTPLKTDSSEGALVTHLNVTDRMRSELELRNREERFRSIIEHSADIISIHHIDGAIIYQSPSIKRLLGYEQGELVGLPLMNFIHPEDALSLTEGIERVRSNPGIHRPFETRLLDKSGAWRWFECTGTNLLDNPAVGGLVFNARDITARKQTEASLRSSERLIQSVLTAAPIIVFALDEAKVFTLSEGRGLEKLGFKAGEAVGRMANDLYRDHPQIVENIERALSGETFNANVEAQDRVFQTWYSPCKDSTGRINGVFGVATDVTELKRVEAELAESRNQLAFAQRTAHIGSWEWNPSTAQLVLSEESFHILALDAQKPPRTLEEFIEVVYPEDRERYRRLVEISLVDKKPVSFNYRIIGSDGGVRTIRSMRETLTNETGKIVRIVGTEQDITETLELEDQLRQAQRMESVGRLAGGVAHDFNNLLTAIKGYAELALRKISEGHPLYHYLMEINKAGERATGLTRQLLAFSRKQMLQPKVLNLNEVITGMAKMLRSLIGEDIELQSVQDGRLGLVAADPGQIEQVLMNLAVNARDAMPYGGTLRIETQNVLMDEEIAGQFLSVRSGPHVLVTVSDTGTGMDAETQARIFEPFFTTKEVGKGTGLGLSTVYGIVKQSNGYISVESWPGRGTTFRIYLPRVDEPTKETESAFVVAPQTGTEVVLLVEDEEMVRNLTRTMLEEHGYKVIEAADGQHALALAEAYAGHIDLMMTDVVMPGMSGKALAERMAETRPGMKVLYTSGYTDEAIVHHGVLDEGTAFIAKPFSFEALAHKVREVLDNP